MANINRYNFTCSMETKSKRVELHATGCRDLAHLKTAKREVIADGFTQVAGPMVEAGIKVVVLPCCAPKRMAAAGRVLVVAVPDAAPEAAPATEPEAEVAAAS